MAEVVAKEVVVAREVEKLDALSPDARRDMLLNSEIRAKNKEEAPGDYNPYAHRKVIKPTNDCETLAHLLKGCLGSGILAMPLAIYYAGLFFGLFCTLLVGFILTYCVYLIVRNSQRLCKRMRVPLLALDEVAENALKYGPQRVRKFAMAIKWSMNIFLIIDLFGCCVVYSIFTAKNIKQVVEDYQDVRIDLRFYILFQLPLLLAYIMIRRLKYLAPLSLIADIFIVVGMCITFRYIFVDQPPISEQPIFGKLGDYPLYFGLVIFALEGVGVVMPLENNMVTPEHYISGPCVMFIGFACVTIFYTFVGFFGCWRYGDDIKGSVTLNVPETEIGGQLVKILFAIALFQTFGLQFYVPFQIIWRSYEERFGKYNLLIEYCLRWIITTICVCFAIMVPRIGAVMGLVGALCLSFVGIIYPAIIDLAVCYDVPGYGKFKWRLWTDLFLLIFGIMGFAFGTVCSIYDIIEVFGSNKSDHGF